MKKLLRNTFIYGLGIVLTKSIGIILLPLLTRYLTPSDYGVIGILMMFSIFLSAVLSFGFGTSIGIVYFEKKTYEERLNVIFISFWILLWSSLLFFLVAIFFKEQISYTILGDRKFFYEVILAFLSTFFSIISMPLTLNIQFLEKASSFVKGNSIVALIGLISNILLVIIFKRGLKGYFEAYLITQITTFIIFTVLNRFNFKLKFDREIAKKLFKYGLPMVPSFFSLFILAQGNRYILRFLTDLSSVGIYTVGYNIGSITQMIVNSFQQAWTPYFLSFTNKQEEAIEHFGEIVKFFVIFIGFICLCFFIYSKTIASMFLPKTYIGVYKIIGLVSLSNLFLGLFFLFLPPMYFEKEVKSVSLIQAITAIISVLANFLLIYYFKEFGAAIAFCLGYFVMFALTCIYNEFFSKSKLKNYKIDKNIYKISIVFIIFIFFSFFPRDFNLLGEALFSLTMLILFLLTLLLTLNKNEIIKLKTFVTKFGYLRS